MQKIIIIISLFLNYNLSAQNYFYLDNKNEKFLNVFTSSRDTKPELFTVDSKIQKVNFDSDLAEISISVLDGINNNFFIYPNDTVRILHDNEISVRNHFQDNYDKFMFTNFIPINNYEQIKNSPPVFVKKKIELSLEQTYLMSIDTLNFYYNTKKIDSSFYFHKSKAYYFQFLKLALEEKDQNTFIKYFKESVLSDEKLLNYVEYRRFFKQHFEFKYNINNSNVFKTLSFIDQNYIGGHRGLLLNIYSEDCSKLKAIPKTDLAKLSDDTQNLIQEKCVKNAQIFTPPNKTVLQDDKGKTITWEDYIKNQAGKVVYVDFWASWCVPCKAYLPHTMELQEFFNNEKVTILYVSIDDDVTKWKNAEQNNNLIGKQSYLLLNAKNNNWLKSLNIMTIPRYLLYNKQGKLVNKDTYSPDKEELKGEIKNLLAE